MVGEGHRRQTDGKGKAYRVLFRVSLPPFFLRSFIYRVTGR